MTGFLNPKMVGYIGHFFFAHDSRCVIPRPWDFPSGIASFSYNPIQVLGEVLTSFPKLRNLLEKSGATFIVARAK